MKSKKVLSLLLAAVFMLSIVLSGCSSSTKNSSGKAGNSSSNGKSATNTGGTLTIAELSDATQLDPAKGTDIPSANVYQGKIYENLVTQDKNMKIQPQLATSWKRVDDLTWQFNLRQDM